MTHDLISFQSHSAMFHIVMPNIRNVDLNLLVVFDALFDERSVTRAAARLSLTQPTVSGMLQRLRRTFADQLFLRSSHGIISTPRAEAVAGSDQGAIGAGGATFRTSMVCGCSPQMSSAITPAPVPVTRARRRVMSCHQRRFDLDVSCRARFLTKAASLSGPTADSQCIPIRGITQIMGKCGIIHAAGRDTAADA
jgi:hypothetical protein